MDSCCNRNLFPRVLLPAGAKLFKLPQAVYFNVVGSTQKCTHKCRLPMLFRDVRGVLQRDEYVACVADFETPPLLAAHGRRVLLQPHGGWVELRAGVRIPIERCEETGLPVISYHFEKTTAHVATTTSMAAQPSSKHSHDKQMTELITDSFCHQDSVGVWS